MVTLTKSAHHTDDELKDKMDQIIEEKKASQGTWFGEMGNNSINRLGVLMGFKSSIETILTFQLIICGLFIV